MLFEIDCIKFTTLPCVREGYSAVQYTLLKKPLPSHVLRTRWGQATTIAKPPPHDTRGREFRWWGYCPPSFVHRSFVIRSWSASPHRSFAVSSLSVRHLFVGRSFAVRWASSSLALIDLPASRYLQGRRWGPCSRWSRVSICYPPCEQWLAAGGTGAGHVVVVDPLPVPPSFAVVVVICGGGVHVIVLVMSRRGTTQHSLT
jgi:hypothetical protein